MPEFENAWVEYVTITTNPQRQTKVVMKIKETKKGFEVIAKKGDEFEVSLTTVPTRTEARKLAYRLRQEFNNRYSRYMYRTEDLRAIWQL